MHHNQLMLKIKSTPNQIKCIETYVAQLKQTCKFTQEVYDNILISLTEAVNNAIIHGNKEDENKYVRVNCEETKKEVVIRISDEGIGFNPHDVADPTLPQNLECCGGRGVFIMKQLSDKIDFLDSGRTVEMRFKIA